jgi:hypothetical protein
MAPSASASTVVDDFAASPRRNGKKSGRSPSWAEWTALGRQTLRLERPGRGDSPGAFREDAPRSLATAVGGGRGESGRPPHVPWFVVVRPNARCQTPHCADAWRGCRTAVLPHLEDYLLEKAASSKSLDALQASTEISRYWREQGTWNQNVRPIAAPRG